MKKTPLLMMFTLLSTAGYYIGNAVAQNTNNAAQTSDGVLMVEESYGVTTADSNSQNSPTSTATGTSTSTHNSNSSMMNNNGTMTLDETVTEEGYIEEE